VELLEANRIPEPESRIFNAIAEKLPFPDGYFDVVVSVAVLEHVQDLDATMLESLRVLKVGGMLWANVPNYNSVHEGHYNLFWIPRMSKSIAKRYVKLFGRDPVLSTALISLPQTRSEIFYIRRFRVVYVQHQVAKPSIRSL